MTNNLKNTPISVTLSPVQTKDNALLYKLYASTRAQEMALVDWDATQKENFLQMQFKAQLTHYRNAFPEAEHDIIYHNKQPIGRIYVNRTADEIRLLDITLLPQHRNVGVGTFLLKNLLTEATQTGNPLRFYVWQLNHQALRWYKRLGCIEIGEEGAYISMAWQPDRQ